MALFLQNKEYKRKKGVVEMLFQAKWIQPVEDMGSICPVFRKKWKVKKHLDRAVLYMTALGVYQAKLNENQISGYVLAPG